jgi:tRNA (guanosine-2'-O-)-methyltransferase
MQPLKRTKIRKFFKDYKEKLESTDIEVIFLLQSFESPLNVGHMFRLADAVAASKIILTGRTPVPPNSEIRITSMGKEDVIPFEHFPRLEDAIMHIKSENFQLVSVEITENSKIYTDAEYKDKVCFVLGNENDGVYPSALSASEETIYIPMFGNNNSLNVHVSASIVVYDFLRRKLNY